ncbi:MAG: hypothetical protein JSU82_05380 [Rhodospirillales bacterium]|nr:MAG: hypothetical protein JSU82_05380 [Rhodospirillales bacterium]
MRHSFRSTAIAMCLLAAACADSDMGAEYFEISEEESALQFYGPGLAGGYRQFLTGEDQHFVRRTLATYGPQSGEFPFARMYYSETPPNRYFARSLPIEDTIEQWGWFSDKTVEIGAALETVNAIGRVDFLTLTADGVACVIWLQAFGPAEGTGVGSRLLNGFYCRGPGSMMTNSEAESIVKLVGHKEYGAVTPPRDWSAAAPPSSLRAAA